MTESNQVSTIGQIMDYHEVIEVNVKSIFHTILLVIQLLIM